MSNVLDESRKIVQLSERIILPPECDRAEASARASDKMLVAEVLWLRSYLLEDLGDVPLATAYRRALYSLKSISAKAYFTDVKTLRERSISADFRVLVAADPNEAFKQLRRAVTYKWLVTSFPVIWDSESLVSSYRKWIQWVSFDTRLNLRTADFSHQLTLEYISHEQEMKSWSYPEDLMLDLRRIIDEWLEYFPTITNYHALPPTGATLELKRREVSPVTALATVTNSPQVDRYFQLTHGGEDDPSSPLLDPVWIEEMEPMRLDFVPKSPLTNRMISVDTASMLMIQKDLDYYLRQWLKMLPLRVDLRDQERSRKMALKGSRFGEYDTVDLSAASDSVTVSLVRGLFRDTWLLEPLLLTRNARVEFRATRRVLAIEKFAPMGSATCFPIETLVFLAICELAIRRTMGRRGTSKDVRVYGDDIVIIHAAYKELIRLLTLFHFRVNTSKSFSDRGRLTFREACGIECVNGVDISPIRISRKQVSAYWETRQLTSVTSGPLQSLTVIPSHPERIVGLIDFSNRLELAGLTRTRKAFLELFEKHEWFYQVYRVDLTTYNRALKLQKGGVASVGFPTPSFVVPDMTGTNYRLRKSRKRLYAPSSGFQPRNDKALIVRPILASAQQKSAQLTDLGWDGKDVEELAYHFWSLTRESQEDVGRRIPAESVGADERLNYFGRPYRDLSDSERDESPLESDVLRWDWASVSHEWHR